MATYTKILKIRVTPAMLKELEQIAHDMDAKMSWVARRALTLGLAVLCEASGPGNDGD